MSGFGLLAWCSRVQCALAFSGRCRGVCWHCWASVNSNSFVMSSNYSRFLYINVVDFYFFFSVLPQCCRSVFFCLSLLCLFCCHVCYFFLCLCSVFSLWILVVWIKLIDWLMLQEVSEIWRASGDPCQCGMSWKLRCRVWTVCACTQAEASEAVWGVLFF